MDLNVDVAQLKDFEQVTQGPYTGTVKDVPSGDDGKPFADKNGNKFLKVTFQITDGEFAGRSVSYNYVPLEGDQQWKFKELCKALGIHGVLTNTMEMLGKTCGITVENGLYQGRMTANVVSVRPLA